MTLHGTVSLNNHVVTYWSANNVGPTGSDDMARYECVLLDARTQTERVFVIEHRRSEGALSLAAAVLGHERAH